MHLKIRTYPLQVNIKNVFDERIAVFFKTKFE